MCYGENHFFPKALVVGGVALFAVLLIGNGSAFCQEKILGNRVDIQTLFTPSGWMGDGEYGHKYISFSGAEMKITHSPPTSIKITYTFGPARWGGIYWQNKPDNWGDQAGNNYAKMGLSRLTFWAKGETGAEVVEFKTGDIANPQKQYRDSFGGSTGRLILQKEWKKYQINLSDADLKSVIGGFCWVASADYNQSKTITFYLDDIVLE